MTVSGTSAFNPNCYAIIRQAFQNVGAIDETETLNATMYESGLFQLSAMVKEWMATGLHVWTEEEAILFLQQGQVRYLIGGTNLDNVCDSSGYVRATINSPGSTGNTSLTLNSAVGFVIGMYFGVILDNGFTFWTMVSNVAGSVVSFPLPLPSSASTGNFVFAYTTKSVRPLKVPSARLLYYQGLIENPMTVLSRNEYENLPNKYSPGTPTQVFYSPKLVSGEFYIWPQPITGAYGVRFTWYRPIMDFNNPTDTADFPQEWINALIWGLSKEIGPGFTIPEQQWQRILLMAGEKLDLASNYDRESEPIQFGVGVDESQAWGQ